MSVSVHAGDYVIINAILGKRMLGKCVALSKSGEKGKLRLEGIASSEPAVEFSTSEIVANLGLSPNVGSVYGIRIEPLRDTLEHPFWGTVYLHHPMTDSELKQLKRSLSDVSKKLIEKHLPNNPMETRVKTQTGRMMGCFKYRPKAEFDVLTITLDPDMSDLDYRLSHEYAHSLWYRNFSPKMQMAWIKMYHESVTVSSYSDSDLASLLADIKSSGDVRSFARENPDDAPVLRAIFRYMSQTHALSRSHFEMAVVLGEDVDNYWPSKIELGEKQTILTTYAQKCPEELWAEAFSLKFIGKKLPGKIDALLDKSLRTLVK